jgi:extracellular elastinolytic metalloproteinase
MKDNWYEAAVSFHPPHRIVSVVDWASDSPIPTPDPSDTPATYNVFGWGINDPSVGNRSIFKENFDVLASPVGWHTLPFTNDPQSRRVSKAFYRNTTTTWGNNVFAHEDWEGRNSWVDNYRPDGGKDKVFDYPYDPKLTNSSDSLDEAKKYINATVTQLFYTSNMVHDLYYRCVLHVRSICPSYRSPPVMASTKSLETSSSTTSIAAVPRTMPLSRTRKTVPGTTTLTS